MPFQQTYYICCKVTHAIPIKVFSNIPIYLLYGDIEVTWCVYNNSHTTYLNHLKRLSKIINDIYNNTLIYFSTLFLITNSSGDFSNFEEKNKNALPRLELAPFEHPVSSPVLYPLSYWDHWWNLLKINYIILVLISIWPENIIIIVYYCNIIAILS